MRQVDRPEPIEELGAPIRPEVTTPAPVKVSKDVMMGADGRLFTTPTDAHHTYTHGDWTRVVAGGIAGKKA
jgi:hypothetical protein